MVMTDTEKELRKEIRDLKKQLEEASLHTKFLTTRLEAWADKNFKLRSGLLNLTIDDKLERRM
tara:strand:- start:167 stop:355 length:189 start_codon:yes stop_codon:yes gene_type:complete